MDKNRDYSQFKPNLTIPSEAVYQLMTVAGKNRMRYINE